MKSKKPKESGIVFSTDFGQMCPNCSKPIGQCSCKEDTELDTGDGIVRVRKSTKNRKGKAVTVIEGVPLTGGELKKLAKQLKNRCSSGGTIKERIIEIQGDHREILIMTLEKKGWKVKSDL